MEKPNNTKKEDKGVVEGNQSPTGNQVRASGCEIDCDGGVVTISDALVEFFGAMNDSKIDFKLVRNPEGKFTWNGEVFHPLRGNRFGIKGNEYGLTPEIQIVRTSSKHTHLKK